MISQRPLHFSLRRNVLWNLIGNIIYASCQWGTIIVLTKFTSSETVGRFALGLAITAPIFLLSQLQLRSVQATDVKDKYEFGHYLGLRLLTTVLALSAIAVVVITSYYPSETAFIIMVIGLSKAIESISDIFYGLMQRHERMDRIAKSRILRGTIALAALGSIVYLTGEILWGVVGLTAVWGFVLIKYDLKNAVVTLTEFNVEQSDRTLGPASISPIFKKSKLLHLARLALPLGIVMALLSLNANIPRYFIDIYWGEEELGIFAALVYLIVAGNIIVTAVGQALTPQLAKHYALGEINKYKQLLLYMIGFGVLLGAGGVVIAVATGQKILTFLYRPEYAHRSPVFAWLMVAGGLIYVTSFLGYGVTAARCFKAQMPIMLIATSVTYIASFCLIPHHGIKGAAYSLSIGTCVMLILYAVMVKYALIQKCKNSPQGINEKDDTDSGS